MSLVLISSPSFIVFLSPPHPQADISRHEAGGKGWEVYRLILQDRSGQPIMKLKTRLYIADQVRNVLMG